MNTKLKCFFGHHVWGGPQQVQKAALLTWAKTVCKRYCKHCGKSKWFEKSKKGSWVNARHRSWFD